MSSIWCAGDVVGILVPPKEKEGATGVEEFIAEVLLADERCFIASAMEQCWRMQTRSMMSPCSPVAKSYHWLRSVLTLNEAVCHFWTENNTNRHFLWCVAEYILVVEDNLRWAVVWCCVGSYHFSLEVCLKSLVSRSFTIGTHSDRPFSIWVWSVGQAYIEPATDRPNFWG